MITPSAPDRAGPILFRNSPPHTLRTVYGGSEEERQDQVSPTPITADAPRPAARRMADVWQPWHMPWLITGEPTGC